MKAHLRAALTIFALLLVFTGAVYPLAVTGFAAAIFPAQAGGSLLSRGGRVIGSQLIAQNFSDPRYFWGRPSAASNAPEPNLHGEQLVSSSGSNLGPLSQTLVETVKSRLDVLQAADPGSTLPVPADLVTASASGLDPDISLAAAYYQIPRVARARGMDQAALRQMVDRYAQGRQLGILGEPRVNVLLLNLALDGLK
jgi:K+-transporting ATPase ATPase C chain